jgi:hypothetical protein
MSAYSAPWTPQQKCVGVTGGVVADGDNHAGFGYPIVGWVLTDDGVDQQVMNLMNPCLPRTSDSGGVFVGIPISDSGGKQKPQGVQFPV